jgi:hypothetical protein
MNLRPHNIFDPAYFPHTAITEPLLSAHLSGIGQVEDIGNVVHPRYTHSTRNWEKYRFTLESQREYVEKYLRKFSDREDGGDFTRRKDITYVPSFARSNLLEVTNSIHQRLIDVTRVGGSGDYQQATDGLRGGVDLKSNSMNSFLGQQVLQELTGMGKVGLYIDMPPLFGETAADQRGKRPYTYLYQAEDILNWEFTADGQPAQLQMVLLRDHFFKQHSVLGLPQKEHTQFRLLWIENGQVFIQFFDHDGKTVSPAGLPDSSGPIALNIPRIPFVILELSDSLLADVCDVQIALMNMASSDISYSLKSNYPFYVEKFNPIATPQHIKRPNNPDNQGEAAQQKSGGKDVKTGTASGRQIPKDLDYPIFLSPSAEPLRASMEKQAELKQDIRNLMNLSLSRVTATRASAESKDRDDRALEAGLSAIGLELEVGERDFAEIWASYEGGEPATVNYPENWDIRTDEDRRKEAEELRESAIQIPSPTYKKAVAKRTVTLVMGNRVSDEDLAKMQKEIDDADFTIIDPGIIEKDVEQGILSAEDAAKAKNYPEGTVQKAQAEHAERLARIKEAQAGPEARGVADEDGETDSGKIEKEQSRQTDEDGEVSDKTRGEGA